MGFSVYIRLGSVPSLFLIDFFLLDRNRETIIEGEMKLLFQLAITFLALVCTAIAIPAPRGGPGHGPWSDREADSAVEPKRHRQLQNTPPPPVPPRPPESMIGGRYGEKGRGRHGQGAKEHKLGEKRAELNRMAKKKMEPVRQRVSKVTRRLPATENDDSD